MARAATDFGGRGQARIRAVSAHAAVQMNPLSEDIGLAASYVEHAPC